MTQFIATAPGQQYFFENRLRRRQNSGWLSMKIAVFVLVQTHTKHRLQPDSQL
jgi:hypothetical protein